MNRRARGRSSTSPKFTAYEVTLDVWPDVFCFGILLVPKDIKPGERRPVVVCQHGLEGEPMRRRHARPEHAGLRSITTRFAVRLAERGFVTYSPHNFYRGGNEFRQLQRKLYPLKKTMYSIILAQHERHLEWLASLPFVDAKRIGFYGLSYGGFTAIRVPPLLDGYCLSISSGEFNDMARKKASTRDLYSYPFYPGYEIFEWNLANTFNYGDLAGFMVPRPFMVERGHDDGVAPGRVGRVGVREGATPVRQARHRRQDRDRVLQRRARDPRRRHVQVPPQAPELAGAGERHHEPKTIPSSSRATDRRLRLSGAVAQQSR